jgi:DHA1 family inner membrane transport protein
MARPRLTTRPGGGIPYFSLITLATAVFVTVTIEMLPTGLLPQMSVGLGVTESQIGLTVSIFAFTVVITSAPLSILTRRVPRHVLLISVLLVLAVSASLSALSVDYAMLVASRILGGIAHGVFWSVAGAYAAYLVPKEHLGRAVAIVLGGGSLAFVLGVPLGTALGAALGWRLSFWIMAGLAIVGALVLLRFIPRVDHLARGGVVTTPTGTITVPTEDDLAETPAREQSVAAVVFVSLITAVTMIGQYTFYTFIAPYFLGPVGLKESEVSPALFAYGAAGAISLVLVALWLGRRPRLWLVASMVFLLAAVLALAIAPQIVPLALVAFFLWGLTMGNLPPLLQTRVLHAAPMRIRDTANAFYTTAFNIGIGGGALLGSLVLAGLGISALPWVFAGILVVAIALTVVSDLVLSRRSS